MENKTREALENAVRLYYWENDESIREAIMEDLLSRASSESLKELVAIYAMMGLGGGK